MHLLALALSATMIVSGNWVPAQPPARPLTSFDVAIGLGQSSIQTLEMHYDCTLGVTDPHDRSTACLAYSPAGVVGSLDQDLALKAEAETAPGDCIIGVRDPHDGSVICAARKER